MRKGLWVLGTFGALIWLAGEDFTNSQATHQFNQVVIACQRVRMGRGASPRSLMLSLHVADVGEHRERGDIPEGLIYGVKVTKEQPDFLGVELDRRLGTAFDPVVAEVIVEDFW